MKAQLIKAGEEHRIMSESDFQSLVVFMKILRSTDEIETLNNVSPRSLSDGMRVVLYKFLNANED